MPTRNSPDTCVLGEQGMIMVSVTDPPSAERKRAKFWARLRGLFRTLVDRRTLMIAFRIVFLMTRITQLLKQLFGDF
jgi:hypothetical protein